MLDGGLYELCMNLVWLLVLVCLVKGGVVRKWHWCLLESGEPVVGFGSLEYGV